ncbi:putative pentatricopeptide repeat-containing protein At3g25970 [Coffea arabica]|uniref:Pentatricopeptide repeat-containing protein At3g25970 n=1 Tax=Coffea arabica TaxID=13443 RepID=A0ABM4UWP8_COFAR
MRPLQPLVESSVANLSKVVAAHCHAIKAGVVGDVYTANNIMNGYKNCGRLDVALKLFDEMPERDTASWNTMIAGYVNSREFFNACDFFKHMKINGVGVDGYTFGSILKGVAANGGIFFGQQVHSDVVKWGYGENVYSGSALVDMYAKCGRVEDADRVFQYMPERNSVSWNALIAGYAEIGDHESCFQLLKWMDNEGVGLQDGTFVPLLTLLDDSEYYELTMQIHAKVLKLGLWIQNTVLNAMITSYSGCGSLKDARRVFSSASGYRDLVTWNSMLAAYLQHDRGELAFKLFWEMELLGLDSDLYTYTSIISACSGDAEQAQGRSLHALVIKRGLEKVTAVSNSLSAMYLKSNNRGMEDAIKVFDCTEMKDSVSWNSILTGLSQKGFSENSLETFQNMLYQNLEIDHYTLSAALRSCSDLATLQLGKQIHVFTIKSGFEKNDYVTSALIFMYSKSGSLGDAWKSFTESPGDSSITWNSIMFAYAQHGQGKVALDLFFQMKKKNVKLDHISLVAVLTACSHIGLVEEGKKFLKSMESAYGIPPRMEHYACAIDLLGRAGRIEEAKELVKEMPFQPDAMVWKTLLGACRKCGDIEMATEVASHLLELEPEEHCTYVLLSDMYGHFEKWDEIATVKKLMRERRVKKVPGWSWMEINNEVHSFNAEDHSHPECQEMYQLLRELTNKIKLEEKSLDLDINIEYFGNVPYYCPKDTHIHLSVGL